MTGHLTGEMLYAISSNPAIQAAAERKTALQAARDNAQEAASSAALELIRHRSLEMDKAFVQAHRAHERAQAAYQEAVDYLDRLTEEVYTSLREDVNA